MSAPVVVVGGGVNALVCATLLARAGRSVTLFERRGAVGGGARTAELAPGFRVPALAHTTGPLRRDVADALGLEAHGLRGVATPVWMTALDGRGRAITLYHDADRPPGTLGPDGQGDAARWPTVARTRARLGAVLASVLAQVPPDLDAPAPRDLFALLKTVRQFRALGRDDAHRLLRWGPMPVADLVSEIVESPLLQAALAADGLFGSFLGPWSAGSGLLFLLAAANDAAGRAETLFVQGGPGALAAALLSAATAAGVRVRTGEAVEAIVTDDRGVRGVRLAGGPGTVDASLVVSGLDPKRTLLGLCDPVALPPEFQWRLRNYRTRGVLAKVNLALGALPVVPGADREALTGRIRIAPDVEFLERAFDHAKYGRFSPQPWLEATIPTLLDPSLAPPHGHVLSVYAQFAPYQLQPADAPDGPRRADLGGEAWDAPGVREALGEAVLATLDRAMPGVRGLVVAGEVITPLDLERSWGYSGGDVHHGELGLDQLFTMRPLLGWGRYRTPIDGLWLCGAGTHPGLGLTGGSGMNAATAILRSS
jgi:phytoene dehydrogenase-like protein